MMTYKISKIRILFLCTGNSCRSQMAEGWVKTLKDDSISAYSAGIEKHGLNPDAVKVMAEAGVDISKQQSKMIDDLPVKEFDYVVTLCGHANETCPFLPGRKIHVGFDDPPKLVAEAQDKKDVLRHYRRVRDEIKGFIENLPEVLLEKGRNRHR